MWGKKQTTTTTTTKKQLLKPYLDEVWGRKFLNTALLLKKNCVKKMKTISIIRYMIQIKNAVRTILHLAIPSTGYTYLSIALLLIVN